MSDVITEHAQLPAIVERGALARRGNAWAPSAVPPAPGQRTMASMLARRWKYLLFVAVVAFVASAVGANQLVKTTWAYNSTLLCGDLGPSASPFALDVATLQNMIKTRRSLERLVEQFNLNCTLQYLERSIDTSAPYNSRSIIVTLRWEDPTEAEALLNALASNCVTDVNRSQTDRLKRHRDECEAHLEAASERMAAAQRELGAFCKKADIVDFDADLLSLRTTISGLEKDLQDQRQSQNALLTQKNRPSSLATAVLGSRSEINQLQASRAARRKELDRFKELRQEVVELTANVDAALAARERASTDLHAADKMLSSQHALSVIHSAQLSLTPPTTNEKKLFVGMFLAIAFALCSPMVLWELRGTKEDRILSVARKLGLPVLASGAAAGHAAQKASQFHTFDEEYARLLALRMQQFAHVPGSVILLSGLDEEAMPVPILHRLASCLAQRDHRVVVVALDAQYATESALSDVLVDRADDESRFDLLDGGLGGYLSLVHSDVDLLTMPTAMPSVDYILPGSAPLPREGFGTQRMSELINRLRQQYTTVIISGPGVNRTVDLELLASRADGIVLHAYGSQRISPAATHEVQHLIELGASVFGIIS